MEGDREIAAPGFADRYPELHHYTDLEGLRGITTNNSLWATHFAYLNDTTEIFLLRDPMVDELILRVKTALKKIDFPNRHMKRTVMRDNYLKREIRIFVDAMFKTAFEKNSTVYPMAETYIASLCSHHPNQMYEVENGYLVNGGLTVEKRNTASCLIQKTSFPYWKTNLKHIPGHIFGSPKFTMR